MSDHTLTDRLPLSSDANLATFAALATLAWVVLEFAFRRGLGPRLADPLGSGLAADGLMLAVAFPLIAALVAVWGTRVDIAPSDWEYDRSPRSLGAGVAGFVVVLVVVSALTAVYTEVLGLEPPAGLATFGASEAATWAVILFVVGNAVVVPISEELAWRGVVQTALADSYGTYAAVGVTALAFVAKHLVVDVAAPLFRVTSLVVLALVVCGLRARYGTASSTAAHLGVNVVSTVPLLLG